MATEVVMPKQGNTVESCTILEWKVKEGDVIEEGTVICEAETDKSTIDVESTAAGTVLKLLYKEGDDVLVMHPILVVGEKGESYSPAAIQVESTKSVEKEEQVSPTVQQAEVVQSRSAEGSSPRARTKAESNNIDISQLSPSGPKGLIIERDVEKALAQRAPISPVAKEQLGEAQFDLPSSGSGIGGRILSKDLLATSSAPSVEEYVETPVKGIRKVTASRMHASVSTTAQFTINAYADATALQTLRSRFKESSEALGLQRITINDIILFAVSRTISQFPFINSHYLGETIRTFNNVHLGCAVDTPKGLLVPVIRFANLRSLKEISDEFKRLASSAIEGKAQPDELTGGTFTVTNLGALGVDTFTPVINIPEVAILGVGGISMRAVSSEDDILFTPHIALSLTIDHQAVDGAPAARFLQALCANIANVDTLLAL